MRRWSIGLFVLLGCGGPGAADGGHADGGTCSPPPSACMSPTPSYADDIAPIIETKCEGCHSDGHVAASWPLTSYGAVNTLSLEAQAQVGACLMPEADAGQLTLTERAELLDWLVCGAPDN